jgi:hypothetical protein
MAVMVLVQAPKIVLELIIENADLKMNCNHKKVFRNFGNCNEDILAIHKSLNNY